MLVTNEGCVHRIVDAVNAYRVQAYQAWRDLGDSRSNTQCMSCCVVRAEWSAFTPPFKPVMRGHAHDRCIECAVFAASRQLINATGVGQVDLKDFNFCNLQFQHLISFQSGMTRTSFPMMVFDKNSFWAVAMSFKG